MSGIGRIFLVLNLLLSAAFLGWASNTLSASKEYRDLYEQEQRDRAGSEAALQEQIDTAVADLRAAQNTTATLRNELNLAQASLESTTTDLEDARSDNDQLKSDVGAINATLGDVNDTIAQLESAKDAAVAEARQLERERDDAVAAAAAAQSARTSTEDELHAANMDIASLEMALETARGEASRLDAQLATALEIANLTWEDVGGQAYVEATVLSVKSDMGTGLVALNVGSEHEVKKGMTFEIWSGSQYKGQVRVESVLPNMCSALVTVSVPGASMAEGDNAATRL